MSGRAVRVAFVLAVDWTDTRQQGQRRKVRDFSVAATGKTYRVGTDTEKASAPEYKRTMQRGSERGRMEQKQPRNLIHNKPGMKHGNNVVSEV